MKSATSTLAFVYGACVAAVALGFGCHGLGVWTASVSLALGLLTGLLAWRTTAAEVPPKLGVWDWILLGVFTVVSLRAFGWLIFTVGDDVRILSPNNRGDISLHLNLIRNLASGVPFWPESTILSGIPMSYPIGADLFNALLERLGVPTFSGLIATAIAGATLTGFALWRWGGAFGLAAVLFNGGLAGFAIFSTWQLRDYQADLSWKNLFLTMIVTQRGLLVALPAGLLLLAACRSRFFQDRTLLPYWLEVVFYAGLPLFNVHAFIFVSLIYAVVFLFDGKSRRALLLLVGNAFIPATILVLLVTGFFTPKSNVRFEPDWIGGKDGLWGWAQSFGLTVPLLVVLGLVVSLRRGPSVEARCFVLPALFIFILCCFFAFAPWPWDNMKLILWSWLVMAPYLWSEVLRPLHWLGRSALCFALFFSGAVSLVGGLSGHDDSNEGQFGFTIAKVSELAAWRTATADIPFTDHFAIQPDYNHPLILLGRRLACGYEGHLWSHGLPYQDKYAILKSALNGSTPWSDAVPLLGVEWIALRRDERPASGLPASGDLGTIYNATTLVKPDPDIPILPPTRPRSVDSSW